MPRISEFYGIVITMHWREHPPPHVHAWYGGVRAAIDIVTGAVIEEDLPPRILRLIRRWVRLHQDELLANWELARRQRPVMPIDPLP